MRPPSCVPIFFQSEGVLTEVEERVVEINPSEHPGTGSLETHAGYAMKMMVEVLFKHHVPSSSNRRRAGRGDEE